MTEIERLLARDIRDALEAPSFEAINITHMIYVFQSNNDQLPSAPWTRPSGPLYIARYKNNEVEIYESRCLTLVQLGAILGRQIVRMY